MTVEIAVAAGNHNFNSQCELAKRTVDTSYIILSGLNAI
jgi:hypothetical protein